MNIGINAGFGAFDMNEYEQHPADFKIDEFVRRSYNCIRLGAAITGYVVPKK